MKERMVLLNEGLNKLRDLISTNITKGQNGTSTADADQTNTGLGTGVPATLLTLNSKSISDKQITFEHRLDSTVGNGTTFTENELQFSTGESFNRIVHSGISKDSNTQISWFTTLAIENSR